MAAFTVDNRIIHTAEEWVNQRWYSPLPTFTSGKDPRTTDNALLVLCYGQLCRAAEKNWLNAGRSLIDKTYIDMIRYASGNTAFTVIPPAAIATQLDEFIRAEIQSRWDERFSLIQDQQQKIAIEWVELSGSSLFGSINSELLSSAILSYLCPWLPIFPWNKGNEKALKQLGCDGALTDYSSFQHNASRAFVHFQQNHPLCLPKPVYGEQREQQWITEILQNTDWWQRKVFASYLRLSLTIRNSADERLFGCDGNGGHVADTSFS